MTKRMTKKSDPERLAVALAEAEEMLREEHDARMEAVAERDAYKEKLGDWATARAMGDILGGENSYIDLERKIAELKAEEEMLRDWRLSISRLSRQTRYMSEHETLEQIAERAAEQINTLAAKRYSIATTAMVILAALREVEARGEQRAAALGGALLDSAKERAEKAEAEVERLRAALTACQVAANDIAEDNERLRDRLNGELK